MQMNAQHPIAPDSYRLERAGRVLHAGTADGFPNLTKPELRALAATARALASSAEAEIDARPAPFPASLPPWLVMQWLPLPDAAAALRVASSWCGGSEQYYRVFVERHCVTRFSSWRSAARSLMINQRAGQITEFQKRVLAHYEAQPRFYEDSHGYANFCYIPDGEVAAAIPATLQQVRTAAAFLVSLKKLYASPTGQGHVFAGLTSLERLVIAYHNEHGTSDEGCHVHDVAAHLGTDLSLVRAAVDFLEGEDYLIETIDEDHYDYDLAFRSWAKYYSSADLA